MWKVRPSLPIKLAVIEIDNVTVNSQTTAFKKLKDRASLYNSEYKDVFIADIPGTEHARRLFRDIGMDPTKHRPASEALLNRALKEKEFYSVNNLVDAGNWCALDFLLPTCVYDGGKIKGSVDVRIGGAGDSYIGLNNRPVNLNGRYTIADEDGAFGSPKTDSFRTAVTFETKRAVLLIYAPRDYPFVLLKNRADLFAERVLGICAGELKGIQILTSEE